MIADYKKQIYVAQLKKSVSVLEQGFRKAMAEDGVNYLANTELFQSIVVNPYDLGNTGYDEPEFNNKLKKYFNVVNISGDSYPTFKFLDGTEESYYWGQIHFSDGVILFGFSLYNGYTVSSDVCKLIKILGGNMCQIQGKFFLDVNGYKKPNIVGRDIFYMYLSEDGHIYPYAGKDVAILHNRTDLSTNSSYWKNGNNYYNCEDNGNSMGWGCAARIIEDGWIMDY